MADSKKAKVKPERQLELDAKNAWNVIDDKEKKKVFSFSEDYKKFINDAKTEREAVKVSVELLEKNGYVNMDECIKKGKKLKSGDKVYRINRSKNVIAVIVGKNPIEEGMNIAGAHIDCPRLDLKQNPLFEDTELAYLKTHYYGGIKKYQWVTVPLALHGVVIKANGEKVEINIGEAEADPVFYINDLLIHLAKDQMQLKLGEGIKGEQLNILVGSIPVKDEKVKNKVKYWVLQYLNENYGITEEDFLSAEIEAVPAAKARDLGFDRSLVVGYGHDDRVCAYTELRALLELSNVERTCVCVLTDKEEVGSAGNTGSQSKFFENTVAELVNLVEDNYNDLKLKRTIENSTMLSADVTAGVDPNFDGVMEKNNSCYVGRGIVISKYTGVRGKYDTSDANAEFVGKVRKVLNDGKVAWQTGELGKIDQGGGGTIAQYLANYNMDVLDCGIGLLSTHAPLEVASKVDIYMAYRGYVEFYKNMR